MRSQTLSLPRASRANRRRPNRQPPVLLAVCCLLSCLSATIATSSGFEAEINSQIPALLLGEAG